MIHEFDRTSEIIGKKKDGFLKRSTESEPLVQRLKPEATNAALGLSYYNFERAEREMQHTLRRFNSSQSLRISGSDYTTASMKNYYSFDSNIDVDDVFILETEPSTAPAFRRWPAVEPPDDDRLDSEIVTALTVEPNPLPDLTEEKTSTPDSSAKYSHASQETLQAEYLNYEHRILHANQEGAENASLEEEWGSGEGCAHLRVVLSYWKSVSGLYPELRGAVSWGQIKCYCAECEPNDASVLAGN